jgi:hypothetical protein
MTTVVDSSIKSPIILPIGVAYRFTDRIVKNDKEAVKIESVKFYMRSYLSRIPNINGATGEVINNELGDNVAVDLTSEELSSEGEYFAWWSFVTEKEEFQTPEFPVVITDHGPGTGVETGAIVDGVSDHMPVTVNALKKSPNFGERRIQKIATLIQIRVLKTYVQPDEEITAYELPLLDYFSKRVALELCRPGIDYWARQLRTATKVEPTEISSYPDMIQTLEKLRDHLVIELEENWRELAFLVPGLKQRKAVPMPASSLEFHEIPEQNGTLRRRQIPLDFVTKNPRDWQRLSTGWRGNYDLFSPLGFWPSFP